MLRSLRKGLIAPAPSPTSTGDATESLDRQRLERQWLQKVLDSHRRYVDAAETHQRMKLELALGVTSDEPDQQAAAFALTRARHSEAFALSEYDRIVMIYTDLVVKGLQPPGDELLG